jgi:hypothetical protein
MSTTTLTPSLAGKTHPTNPATKSTSMSSARTSTDAERSTLAPTPVPQVRGPQRWLDHACINLTPSFFSLNMGTGITSILLYNFPYPAEWLRILGTIVFVLNIFVFLSLALGNVARYVRFKGVFVATLTHPVAGLFWGTLPMGLVTIVVSDRVGISSFS